MNARSLPLIACATLGGAAAHAQTYALDAQELFSVGTDDRIGSSVAIHDNTAALGSVAHGAGGQVWLIERAADGSWAQLTTLVSTDLQQADLFSHSLALSDGRLIVGAPGEDANGSNAGAAYVFERQLDGSWTQAAKLLASDGFLSQDFGTSVDIDGDYAVVGAPDATVGFTATGKAYVYERQPDGSWVEEAVIVANDAGNNDDFGWSVAISGGRVFVGAPQEDETAANSGSAYLFDRQPDGSWTQTTKVWASDGTALDSFGYAVDLDGDIALAGAWLDGELGTGAGAAYVYELQPDGSWPETAKLTDPMGNSGDHFGMSLSLSGEMALIGAIHDTVGTKVAAGTAHIFAKVNGLWSWLDVAGRADPVKDDHFGAAVGIHEGRMIIGIPGGDVQENDDKGLYVMSHSFAPGDPLAPVNSGTGTPGCNGSMSMSMNRPPEIGMTDFAFTTTNVPSLGVGFLGLADQADAAGADLLGLGFLLHLDLLSSTFFEVLPMTADVDGNGEAPFPIPNDANLVGLGLHAQSVWVWDECPLPPLGFSSSDLVSFEVLAP